MPREISHRGRAWQKGRLSRRRAGKGGGAGGCWGAAGSLLCTSVLPRKDVPVSGRGEWGRGARRCWTDRGRRRRLRGTGAQATLLAPSPRRRHSPLCAFWGGAVTESLNFAGGGTLDGGGAGFEALESPPESQLTVHCTLQTRVPNHMQHT